MPRRSEARARCAVGCAWSGGQPGLLETAPARGRLVAGFSDSPLALGAPGAGARAVPNPRADGHGPASEPGVEPSSAAGGLLFGEPPAPYCRRNLQGAWAEGPLLVANSRWRPTCSHPFSASLAGCAESWKTWEAPTGIETLLTHWLSAALATVAVPWLQAVFLDCDDPAEIQSSPPQASLQPRQVPGGERTATLDPR